jgi:hypothetical protein
VRRVANEAAAAGVVHWMGARFRARGRPDVLIASSFGGDSA